MTREKAINTIKELMKACVPNSNYYKVGDMAIKALEKESRKCTWIKYDYRTIYPKEHDIDNPYWRIPENRMDALKYCPYCGKEIEVEE